MKEDEKPQRGVDFPNQAEPKPKPKPHRATGRKPPGGRRPGAGRPKGATNALEVGEVAAIKAMRWRVPDAAPPPAADAAGEAFTALVEVMRKPFVRGSREKLAAARAIREEVCGPVKQQVEHSGGVHVTWGFDPSGGEQAGAESQVPVAAEHEPEKTEASQAGGASTWSSEGVRPNWVEDVAPEPEKGNG